MVRLIIQLFAPFVLMWTLLFIFRSVYDGWLMFVRLKVSAYADIALDGLYAKDEMNSGIKVSEVKITVDAQQRIFFVTAQLFQNFL